LVKKLSDKATTPTRGSALAAGYDLYAAEDKVVPANGKVLVDLQLSIAVPEGTYGRVAPRSGLGMLHIPYMAPEADSKLSNTRYIPVLVLLTQITEDQ